MCWQKCWLRNQNTSSMLSYSRPISCWNVFCATVGAQVPSIWNGHPCVNAEYSRGFHIDDAVMFFMLTATFWWWLQFAFHISTAFKGAVNILLQWLQLCSQCQLQLYIARKYFNSCFHCMTSLHHTCSKKIVLNQFCWLQNCCQRVQWLQKVEANVKKTWQRHQYRNPFSDVEQSKYSPRKTFLLPGKLSSRWSSQIQPRSMPVNSKLYIPVLQAIHCCVLTQDWPQWMK